MERTALAVYDNLENTKNFPDHKRMFPPQSKHFVCFDKLNYNVPIIFGLNPPTTAVAKSNLNDFLYATLMMKMLLEKYQDLQVSARVLLSSHKPARVKTAANDDPRPEGFIGQTMKQLSGKMPPIYQTRQNLDHAGRRAMWRVPAITKYPYGGNYTLDQKSLAAMAAHEKTIGSDYQQLAHLTAPARGAMFAVMPLSVQGSIRSEGIGRAVSLSGNADSLNASGRALNNYSDHSDLPWVIQLLTDAMDYATNNQGEALIFLFVILGFVGFLACFGRRV